MTGYRLAYIYVILSLTTNELYGQTRGDLNGTVVLGSRDTVKPSNVKEVMVKNMSRGKSTKPDHLGNFFVPAQIGDSLTFYLKGLPRKYITIKSYEHLTVYLDSTILLDEVSISANVERKANLKETARRYSKQNSIYFNGKPPIALLSPFSGSPITFFRELLSEDGKRVRRFNRFINQQIELDEIDAKFNSQIIKRAIPAITDEEIESFKSSYAPDIEMLERWSTYELYDYIKRSYSDFKKRN